LKVVTAILAPGPSPSTAARFAVQPLPGRITGDGAGACAANQWRSQTQRLKDFLLSHLDYLSTVSK